MGMKTLRFTKVVAVDLFDGKSEEIASKSFNRWDTVRVNAIHEMGHDRVDIELADGSTVYDVPVNAFEVLA
jgi:hypothetical protein